MTTKVEPTVEKWEFKCSRCKKVEKVPGFVAEHLRGKNPPWCNKCEDEYRYWLNNPNQALSVQEAKAEMIARIEGMRVEDETHSDGKYVYTDYKSRGYNQALDDLLASLKQEEEKV